MKKIIALLFMTVIVSIDNPVLNMENAALDIRIAVDGAFTYTFGDVDFDYFFSFLKSIEYSGSLTIENHRISDNDNLVYNFNKAYEFIANGLERCENHVKDCCYI